MTVLALSKALEFTKTLAPGLLVAALVAMAAAFLGSHYKGSMLLFALLLGLVLHFISEDKRCAAGIQFASSTVLRLGVALLVAVSLTIALGLLLARLFKVESTWACLSAVQQLFAVLRRRWPFQACCLKMPT